MPTTDLKGPVEAYIDGANARDVVKMSALLSSDIVVSNIGFPDSLKGKDSAIEFSASLFRMMPDFAFVVASVTAGDGVVSISGRLTGTVAADALNVGAEIGNAIDLPICEIFAVVDGKITSITNYFCTATFADQLGVRLTAFRPTAGSRHAGHYAWFWHNEPDKVGQVYHAITDDIRQIWPGPGGIGSGKRHYQQQFARLVAALPDIKVDVVDFMAERERCFIEFLAYGTGPDGERVEFHGIDRFHVRDDGLVYNSKVMFDPAVLIETVARRAMEVKAA